MDLTVVLDHAMLEKVFGYYVYRSEETLEDRPAVDGLYIQRSVLGDPPPESMRVAIHWD